MKYVKTFDDVTTANASGETGVECPFIGYIKSVAKLIFPRKCYKKFKFKTDERGKAEASNNNAYLTFTFAESSGSTLSLLRGVDIEISDDATTWTSWDGSSHTGTGKKIYVRGKSGTNVVERFSGKFIKVDGNIMSLIDYENMDTASVAAKQFGDSRGLFYGCTSLVDAKDLSLPATTLAANCYKNMFYGCTSLTKAPELPATTLATNCYLSMFDGCTSLTKAPELPATTLAEYCYYYMFNGCTSLVTGPTVIPATTSAKFCCFDMFRNCTSLIKAPELPATTLAEYCYYDMFYLCASLTKAPELPATTLASYCYSHMFHGCTSLTNAPELPATTLAGYCYENMFYGCTSLINAPELPATTLKANCYYYMFGGCTSLNYVKCDATDISASSCTALWLKNVAEIGDFYGKSAAGWTTGTSAIPTGWTSHLE